MLERSLCNVLKKLNRVCKTLIQLVSPHRSKTKRYHHVKQKQGYKEFLADIKDEVVMNNVHLRAQHIFNCD